MSGRLLLGIACGVGMPPATAMVSEVTPKNWRVATKAVSSCAYVLGSLVVAIFAALEDPTLANLNWRRLVVMASIAPLIWFVLALFFLRESPVYLASVGRLDEAKEGFDWMARTNGVHVPELRDEVWARKDGKQEQPGLRYLLGIVFGEKYCYITVAACYCCFAINMLSTGDGYAAPQILQQVSEMLAAYQLVLKYSISFLALILVSIIAQMYSRRSMIILCHCLNAFFTTTFAWGGSRPEPRGLLASIAFQNGTELLTIGAQLGSLVIYQLAVEYYPTIASSTGGAVIIGGGRLGAVIAPLIFETMRSLTGSWTSFYYLLCGMNVLAIGAAYAMPYMRV